jgi:RNA polymerase-binding protein DksA
MSEFERRLGRERREAYRALVTADTELASFERHSPGESMDDAATETTSRMLENLRERDRRTLTEIDAAAARLSIGTFGACVACARPIRFERLQALPAARLCVACEEREEADNKR